MKSTVPFLKLPQLDYTSEILEATEDACGDLFHAEFCADSESGLKFEF